MMAMLFDCFSAKTAMMIGIAPAPISHFGKMVYYQSAKGK
jgi:hypothetical protein